MDAKVLLVQRKLENREAADAVAALVKVLSDAPQEEITHAYLVKHADKIEEAAKRVCKGIAAWRKHH